jgi:hypothetical protein
MKIVAPVCAYKGDTVNPKQGCGSGFNGFVYPDPYLESGTRGNKIKKKFYILLI